MQQWGSLFTKYAERENRIHADRYKEPERVLTLSWHATGLLDNGGLAWLFEGDFPGDPGFIYTAAAFLSIGALKAYEAFQETMGHFPNGELPSSIEERLALYDGIPEPERERIDGLFYEDSARIEQLLALYIRNHRQEYLDQFAQQENA